MLKIKSALFNTDVAMMYMFPVGSLMRFNQVFFCSVCHLFYDFI